MSEQRTLASVAYEAKGEVTRRERFLAEMGAVIPWTCLLPLIVPHYPTAGRGRLPLSPDVTLHTAVGGEP